VTEHHGLALVAATAPKAVICLLSALSFHQIGTQLPHEVWIALYRRRRRPSLTFPRLRVVRFGGDALTEGVEIHRVEGETVRVYSAAKTIADSCNKIGLDVALEALRIPQLCGPLNLTSEMLQCVFKIYAAGCTQHLAWHN
jgi:predicted transcriptional regulator of viral defense system